MPPRKKRQPLLGYLRRAKYRLTQHIRKNELRLKEPTLFYPTVPTVHSPLEWNANKADLYELLTALFLQGDIVEDGHPAYYTTINRIFSWALNLKYDEKCNDEKTRILERAKKTPFLDKLKQTMIKQGTSK